MKYQGFKKPGLSLEGKNGGMGPKEKSAWFSLQPKGKSQSPADMEDAMEDVADQTEDPTDSADKGMSVSAKNPNAAPKMHPTLGRFHKA